MDRLGRGSACRSEPVQSENRFSGGDHERLHQAYPNFPNNMTIRHRCGRSHSSTASIRPDDGGDRSGSSNYHAFVFKWEKRYANGLTFLNSYVFSKVLSDVGAANAGTFRAVSGQRS
jgi:hypothetical protein